MAIAEERCPRSARSRSSTPSCSSTSSTWAWSTWSTVAEEAEDKSNVTIEMTMTSPACPAGPQLVSQSKTASGAAGRRGQRRSQTGDDSALDARPHDRRRPRPVGDFLNRAFNAAGDRPLFPAVLNHPLSAELARQNGYPPVRIFLYEFVTGGGWSSLATGRPPDSLLAEGRAMAAALAADFLAAGCTVDLLADATLSVECPSGCCPHEVHSADDERAAFERLAVSADWTVVIAPSSTGTCTSVACASSNRAGGLLGPSPPCVTLTADKQATADHLAAHGVRVPLGIPLPPGEPLPRAFDYPAVLKPRDGAGSQGIERVGPVGRRAVAMARKPAGSKFACRVERPACRSCAARDRSCRWRRAGNA